MASSFYVGVYILFFRISYNAIRVDSIILLYSGYIINSIKLLIAINDLNSKYFTFMIFFL